MKCILCGAEIDDGSSFCPICGGSVSSGQPDKPGAVTEQPEGLQTAGPGEIPGAGNSADEKQAEEISKSFSHC